MKQMEVAKSRMGRMSQATMPQVTVCVGGSYRRKGATFLALEVQIVETTSPFTTTNPVSVLVLDDTVSLVKGERTTHIIGQLADGDQVNSKGWDLEDVMKGYVLTQWDIPYMVHYG